MTDPLRFTNNFEGNFRIEAHPVEGGGALEVADTLVALSTLDVAGDGTGGSIVTPGGVSISKNVLIGYGLRVTGTTTVGTSLGVNSASMCPVVVTNRNANGISGMQINDNNDTAQLVLGYLNNTAKSFLQSKTGPLSLCVNPSVNPDQILLTGDGTVVISSNASSTDKLTGALKVGGGLGVGGSVNQNYSTSTTGYSTYAGVTDTSPTSHFTLRTDSGVNRWSLGLIANEPGTTLGGADLAITAFNLDGTWSSIPIRMQRDGKVMFTCGTDASSVTNGSVSMSGGLSVLKTIYANDVSVLNNLTSTSITIGNTTIDSVNTNDLYFSSKNDTIYLRNLHASASGQFTSSTSQFQFFTTTASPSPCVSIDKSTSTVIFYGTAESTSVASGTVQVGGGIGCGGRLTSANVTTGNIISETITNHVSLSTSTSLVTTATAATSVSDGPLTVLGGIAVSMSSFIQSVTVPGFSYLTSVHIDTTNNALSITGTNGIDALTSGNMTFNSASTVKLSSSTISTVTIDQNGITSESTGQCKIASSGDIVVINSGSSVSNAIRIATTNASGGISMVAGTSGFTSTNSGPISLTSTGGVSQWTHTQTAAGQGLNLALNGTGASVFALTSTGTSSNALNLVSSVGGVEISGTTSLLMKATAGTVSLKSLTATGPMLLSQQSTAISQNLTLELRGSFANTLNIVSEGTSTSAITLQSSAGGISQTAVTRWSTTVSNGPFTLSSTSPSLIQQTASGDGQDLNISLIGTSAGSSRLILSSSGTAQDALKFVSNVGGCDTIATRVSTNATAGGIQLTSRGGITGSKFLHTATANAQDVRVGVIQDGSNVATNSRLILEGFGSGPDAILMRTLAGGITTTSTGPIKIDCLDTTTGISIGTSNAGIPVFLGDQSSVVTVNNSLHVLGNFTVIGAVNSVTPQVVMISDNTLLLNAGPSGSSDTGIISQRYQKVDLLTGDIVTDVCNETGFCQSGSTSSQVVLNGSANGNVDFYKDWWIKITLGTGNGQIRKIKSYVPGTQTATIYANGESDGSNWATVPDTTSKYELFGHTMSGMFYSEASDYYDFIYTNRDPLQNSFYNVTGRPEVRVGALRVDTVVRSDSVMPMNTNSVNVNGVAFTNGALTGVSSINGASVPAISTVTLPDNTTTFVSITSTSTTGAYMILVKSTTLNGGATGTFFVCKSQVGVSGVANKVASQRGPLNETIDLTYLANSNVKLYFKSAPGDGLSHSYTVTVFGV